MPAANVSDKVSSKAIHNSISESIFYTNWIFCKNILFLLYEKKLFLI